MNDKTKCKLCEKKFVNISEISKHIINDHNISVKEYYDRFYKEDGEGECANIICGKETRFLSLGRGYNLCCSTGCGMDYGRWQKN